MHGNQDGLSSAERIGSHEDILSDERLIAAAVAFNALAKASELRALTEASSQGEDPGSRTPFLACTPLGPIMVGHNGGMFRPVVNWVRNIRIGYLDAKGSALMPKEGNDS